MSSLMEIDDTQRHRATEGPTLLRRAQLFAGDVRATVHEILKLHEAQFQAIVDGMTNVTALTF
jgi:hypothetical protein